MTKCELLKKRTQIHDKNGEVVDTYVTNLKELEQMAKRAVKEGKSPTIWLQDLRYLYYPENFRLEEAGRSDDLFLLHPVVVMDCTPRAWEYFKDEVDLLSSQVVSYKDALKIADKIQSDLKEIDDRLYLGVMIDFNPNLITLRVDYSVNNKYKVVALKDECPDIPELAETLDVINGMVWGETAICYAYNEISKTLLSLGSEFICHFARGCVNDELVITPTFELIEDLGLETVWKENYIKQAYLFPPAFHSDLSTRILKLSIVADKIDIYSEDDFNDGIELGTEYKNCFANLVSLSWDSYEKMLRSFERNFNNE